MRNSDDSYLKYGVLIAAMLIAVSSICEAQSTGLGLWSGVLVRDFRPDSRLDYSGEYQVRLTDDLHALKSHFFEFAGYYKATQNLQSNFGYRFTIRPTEMRAVCLLAFSIEPPSSNRIRP